MFGIERSNATKPLFYSELSQAIAAVTQGEPDPVANMANIAALVWDAVPDLNWAGFYRLIDGELVLGPFQGKAACIRIALGKGVCGVAAATRTTQRVDDVHAFPGHIACDSASAAELVIPILFEERLFGVFDLDSPTVGRFDNDDQIGFEMIVSHFAPALMT
jgi:L-methionine (R)-S-oxide reductase